MRIAITGHRGLPEDTMRLVDRAIRTELDQYPPQDLVGISCLADGADQIFAQAVLDQGGHLEVVVPASEYRDELPQEAHQTYDALLARAVNVHRLDRRKSDPEAHVEASKLMMADADRLIAVWDSQPARGYGGTADVVTLARDRGLAVTIIWPTGARRDASAVA
ncbi:MAG: hypothetical protein J2P17_06595 [Mycobacterium sp.]|nr:hypothetical protein [Mycobacterium sp.]